MLKKCHLPLGRTIISRKLTSNQHPHTSLENHQASDILDLFYSKLILQILLRMMQDRHYQHQNDLLHQRAAMITHKKNKVDYTFNNYSLASDQTNILYAYPKPITARYSFCCERTSREKYFIQSTRTFKKRVKMCHFLH